MGFVSNLLLVFSVALLTRAVLSAHSVSWWRLLMATFIGLIGGLALVLLFIAGPDLPGGLPDDVDLGDEIVALPFQLVITMALVVTFELVSSRPRRRRRLRRVRPLKALRRRLAIAGRGWEVLRVTARHGLRGGWDRSDPASLADRARRLRLAIEDLGGVYVKLGQLLASRPDLVPPVVTAELARLQSSATPLAFDKVDAVIVAELGPDRGGLTDIDPTPLGAASIAQAHAGRMADGAPVVIKVRRPGLEDDVERDLAILDWVARTAERRIPAAARYGVRRIADEFAEALTLELDFRNEARHTAEIAAAVAGYPAIVVPTIHPGATTDAVLVMDRLEGTPLAATPSSSIANGRQFAEQLCQSQIRAMMRGDRFQGDPHPGNILLLADGRLGLLDFGMTGKLDAFGREFVIGLLAGLRLGEPALVYEALLSGGSVDVDTDREQVERAIASFLSAHAGDELSARSMTDLLRMTAGLGIDVEAVDAAFPGLAAEVASRHEIAALDTMPAPCRNAAIIELFSAKEAIFKAFFPRVGRYFGFDAAEVEGIGSPRPRGRLVEGLDRDYPPDRSFPMGVHRSA